MRHLTVVGIDPGLLQAGVAQIADGRAGWRATIRVEGDPEETGPRYVKLRQALTTLWRRMRDKCGVNAIEPAVVVVEQPELGIRRGHNAEAVLKLYGAFAVLFAEAARLWPRARVVGVDARHWKGNYPKSLTAGMMRAKYGVECRSTHEWDALALADLAWEMAGAERQEMLDKAVPDR